MEINRGWIRRVQEILAGLEKTIRARAILVINKRGIRPTRIAGKEVGVIKNFLLLLVGGGRLKGWTFFRGKFWRMAISSTPLPFLISPFHLDLITDAWEEMKGGKRRADERRREEIKYRGWSNPEKLEAPSFALLSVVVAPLLIINIILHTVERSEAKRAHLRYVILGRCAVYYYLAEVTW